ncbi:hypothetical protein [Methanocella arvoryzae]|uniref:Uncharacterized protein n=1 Tax=Methanocella arvoryzae (strain DSM 22066 / NBRC 105507 / MRE50) TaxID=351160 RepID=Q0W6F0_METAR|nr:hypothetical protein [Methanocella arvoryzae]CAJ36043.1 hypothetical protein RCIX641 [Methanocella arvoryzae MRE50]
MKNHYGVSELLGYAILAGVVMIAAIGVSAGAGDLIAASVRYAGLEEATTSMQAFSTAAARSVASSNEYPEALEMIVPQGYDLVLLDGDDDWHAITIWSGGTELTTLRPGSISLRSAFRSSGWEGGGVFVEDGGISKAEQKPAIFTASSPGGQTSLYLSIPCLSADTAVIPQGRSVVLSLRCQSRDDFSWPVPPGQQVTVEVRTDSTDGWKQVLEAQGFSVTTGPDSVRGSRGGISHVRLATAELQVEIL